MSDQDCIDPFRAERQAHGILIADFVGETIPMILRHADVRQAAKDWTIFSSDAPMRVPIPSEEGVRSVRQLPIEADPPLHTQFRDLLKPIFLRPLAADYQVRIDALIARLIEAATAQPEIEIVRGFALPLQSRALTYLLGMPEKAAEEWISWGTHVFHDGEDSTGKGETLDRYIRGALDAADVVHGTDFFAILRRATVDGRALTIDEMVGIANLTFAGGRDTVIHSVSRIIAYFAAHREELAALAGDHKRIAFATEEFVRFISPLTHIGRVCAHSTQLGSHDVQADERISLCWASANHDERVFEDPGVVRLDRSPNPHLGFGSGVHNCLGATQARAILRSLIQQLATRTSAITVLGEERQYEEQTDYRRWVGFESLLVHMER
ncbi:cytochrome P450 [Novosphingobium sp.]|uniref:cytochrome P450 n=1 Tax=Novosphingobium sp. TaxID=1874826 RepID=UPI0026255171|nr:cytochrome P450 [Novosphingobium sp.]